MKLIIERDALLNPLQSVNGVVERRQTLPILANVLVNAEDEKITLTATDMEVELVVDVQHEVARPGSVTLPARKLLDIFRALPPGATCQIEQEGDQAKVRSAKSRFTLTTMPAADFPSIGDFEPALTLSIEAQVLKEVIEQTEFAMAHQDVRYYLNGLLLEVAENRLRAVATDGHRLALSDARFEVGVTGTHQFIVPRKGVLEIARMLADVQGPVRLAVSANHISVVGSSLRLTSKLIDGRFPDYERVLPRQGDKIMKADRELLRQALARTSILSNEKFRGIRLSLSKGVLRTLAHNPEQEEAEEEIEVDYQGPDLEIGFNVSYLLDVISVVKTSSIVMEFGDANSSCLLRPDGEGAGRYVVMPMRL